MDGESKVGDHLKRTIIRLRSMDDFEAYNNTFDEIYESDDSIFNHYIYK